MRAVHTDLPLHVKPVAPMNLTAFENFLMDNEKIVWSKLKKYLVDEKFLADLASRGRTRKQLTCEFSSKDIDELVIADIASPVAFSNELVFANTFTVDELQKHRRRAITHIAQLNDAAEVNKINLPDLPALRRLCNGATHACTADATAWYFQIELPPHVRRFFAFKDVNGHCFVLNRLPMGASFSCAIGHFITSIVASRCAGAARCATYIDNYVFLGSKKEVRTAKETLSKTANDLGITLTIDEVDTSFDFIGFSIDLTERRIRNSQKSVDKFTEKRREDSTTRRKILSYLGTLLSCLRIHPWALTQSFYVLKFHRLISSEATNHGLDNARSIWPCLSRKLEYLSRVIKQRRWELLDNLPSVSHLVASDASDVGLGLSIASEKGTWNEGRKLNDWERHQPIHVREAIALYEALLRVPYGASVFIMNDNAIVYWGLRHGYSRSHGVNVYLDKISALLRCKQITLVGVTWIDSQHNPADAPSRLIPADNSMWEPWAGGGGLTMRTPGSPIQE
jgi:hypothetical protein